MLTDFPDLTNQR